MAERPEQLFHALRHWIDGVNLALSRWIHGANLAFSRWIDGVDLAQKVVVAVTLLVVVVFLLAGGHQNIYSGSNYELDLGGGHRSYYTVRRTNWPRTIVDIVGVLAVGGAVTVLFGRRKRQGKPDSCD